MALATLLLPSSSTKAAAAGGGGDRSVTRRQHQQHGHHGSGKRKKKPPPLSPQPRTPPPGHGNRRAAMAAAAKKSPQVATAKTNATLYHHQHRVPSKKAAASKSPSSSSSSSSWEQLKSLLSCRTATSAARVHDPAAAGGACGASLCDVVDAAASSAASSAATDRDTAPLTRRAPRAHRGAGTGHSSSSLRGRGLSGCYECRAINVEPMSRRYPRPRELCACSQCGEVFTKAESLEHHQAIQHAVSELGPEDSGRNIVEIIFKSSWLHPQRLDDADRRRRPPPVCHIDRILKVHNAPRTVARFEAYRDAVRSSRCLSAARAAADGNELLRFHSAHMACKLGLNGDTSLCSGAATTTSTTASGPPPPTAGCGVCTAIRHGFAPWAGAHPLGVRTTASSGRAHDCGGGSSAASADTNNESRAMLVCRVIAGRVRRDGDDDATTTAPPAEAAAAAETTTTLPPPSFDSVAGDDAASSSVYGNLEELFVANPRAILPCFVVIYRVLESS